MKKRNFQFDNGAEMYFTYFAIKYYLAQLEDEHDSVSNLFKMALRRTKRGLEHCMDTWGVDYSTPAIHDAMSEEE